MEIFEANYLCHGYQKIHKKFNEKQVYLLK